MKKKILITGAGSGFGLGTAAKLVEQGHDVFGTTVTPAQTYTLSSVGATAIELDITDRSAVSKLADIAPDVLLNNAGRGQLGALATVSMADVRAVFEVNVFGTLQVTQAVLPAMQQRGSGRVIIVSSIAGVFSGLLSGPYAMTKHALEAMAKSLKAEMQPYCIEVCKLNPGPYATGFNDQMVEGVEKVVEPGSTESDFAKTTRERMLGNQLGDVDEIERQSSLGSSSRARDKARGSFPVQRGVSDRHHHQPPTTHLWGGAEVHRQWLTQNPADGDNVDLAGVRKPRYLNTIVLAMLDLRHTLRAPY